MNKYPAASINSSANTAIFDRVPIRTYSTPLTVPVRNFKFAEKWFIVDGSINFADTKDRTATTGDVITFPKNSIINEVKFSQNCRVKQYIDDKDERDRLSGNIRVNWLIIRTILEVMGNYDDFIAFPTNTQWLFDCAEEGNLYEFTSPDADITNRAWNIVDDIIKGFVEKSGIKDTVWYGERRLQTGLKYDKTGWAGEDSIDKVDFLAYTAEECKEAYKWLCNNPLDLIKTEYSEKMHSLKNLIVFIIRKMAKEEEELFDTFMPMINAIHQPRNTDKLMNRAGLPPYVRYGRELERVIKQLNWSTSIGYENMEMAKKVFKTQILLHDRYQ